MIKSVTITSHLPPFPFAFELAVAFVQSSSQTNNRSHFRRPMDFADTESLEHLQQREAKADCLSEFAVVAVFVGFGV